MLEAKYRLKKRKDFAFIYRRRKSFVAKRVAINYLKVRNNDELLIGFSASKKVGNAIVRNNVKRLMRESVRHNLLNIPRGYRLIFNARVASANVHYVDIAKDINYLIGKLNNVDNKGQ